MRGSQNKSCSPRTHRSGKADVSQLLAHPRGSSRLIRDGKAAAPDMTPVSDSECVGHRHVSACFRDVSGSSIGTVVIETVSLCGRLNPPRIRFPLVRSHLESIAAVDEVSRNLAVGAPSLVLYVLNPKVPFS